MIQKNKTCIECGRSDLPHFSNKRCIYCAKKSYKKPVKLFSKKEKPLLDIYFDERLKESEKNPFSFETNKWIRELSRKNICHLLPKRTYKSVEANEDNFVLLTYEEHTRFDHLLDLYRFDDLIKEFPKSFQKLIDFVNDNQDILEDGKLKQKILSLSKS